MEKIEIKNIDCLIGMKDIPDKSIDLILCDLPYDCGKTANRWDKTIPADKLWKSYNRIIKPDGIICLFAQEPFTARLICSNINQYRYSWIWKKESGTGFLNANYKPLTITEDICIFSNGKVGSLSKMPIRYYTQGLKEINKEKHNNPNSSWRKNKGYPSNGNKLNSNEAYTQKFTGYPNNILDFPRDRNMVHPTQKPIALLEYLICTYTNEGETVLDNCVGSGSTAVACVNTNRNFVGYELDKHYFEIAEKRINEASAQKKGGELDD